MKWLVLGFVWKRFAASVRASQNAKRFVECWRKEDQRVTRPLSRAIEHAYVAATRYYNSNRGTGERAIDVSQFFRNKKGRDKEFEIFWDRRPSAIRKRFKKSIDSCANAIQEIANSY